MPQYCALPVNNPSRYIQWCTLMVLLDPAALLGGDKIMFPHTIEWLLYVVAFVGLSAEARRIRNRRSGDEDITLRMVTDTPSALARNAGWMMAGQGAGIVLQAVYFVILARLLGSFYMASLQGRLPSRLLRRRTVPSGTGTVLLRYVSTDRPGVCRLLGQYPRRDTGRWRCDSCGSALC